MVSALDLHDATQPPEDFGVLLRRWRRRRGTSQLDLALDAGTSQRHVSFLETGRARPSRYMVVALAGALDVPLRDRNALLAAAGFSPAFLARQDSDPDLAAVEAALSFILDKQEPFPAIVVDRAWRLRRANAAAERMLAFLAPDGLPTATDGAIDLAAWIFDPDGLGPWLRNRDEVLPHMARRLGPAAPHWAAGGGRSAEGDDLPLPPVLTLDVAKDGVAVRLFSTITTLGEPQDLALHDIRIESFFPADEPSRAVLEAMAGG
ncbi:transcriptional regulator [Thalassobaculum fulvum]|uniref:Transcriptional regulator n=1 Tax=Thalassobaculum fulvum TaxID=1633335 RepID=A0A918XP33_9PROT|nr:helix-turn-helix domain-containing protein [Thalassobaculum fulvum]GHD43673.1 transcriptional regulator [Thalassobaculum fulvum]